MQPYLFAYIGYYQLIAAVEKFVLYDDVTFIKQGWINRNTILGRGKALVFTVPLSGRSSFKRIRDVQVDQENRHVWQRKLLRTFAETYGRAPCFGEVFPLVERVFSTPTQFIVEMARASVESVMGYLGIATRLIETSTHYANAHYKGEERVIDICRAEKAETYINAAGGRNLYSRERFAAAGIELLFLKARDIRYRQFGPDFVPSLSIIDVLMFNPRDRVREYLTEYDLL